MLEWIEWIGILPVLGLTGNWRGYRMGGKAIGGASMSTDMKKKFEAARASGNMDQAKALADKAQDVKDARKADGTIKIEKGFYVRDTLVSPDRFNALPEGQKKEILALQKEFEAIGYVDVRTQLGPDQKSRMSKRQQDSMSQRTLKAFEVERKIKEALKPKTQKDAEKRKAEKDEVTKKLDAVSNAIRTQESFNSRLINSTRNNASKRAYQESLRERAELEAKLAELS